MICSPLRCIELVEGVKSRLAQLNENLPDPLFIWEPVPDLCVPSELDNTISAFEHVDVISPNHAELAQLFSVEVDSTTAAGDVNKKTIEECSARLLNGIKEDGTASKLSVVVRSGKDGCYIASSSGVSKWLPAYHQTAEKVVDPTGGGNGFLGGFSVGLARTDNLIEAATWGNVGASFCIEQVGVPVLGTTPDGKETWNGIVAEERLKQFQQRCKQV